MTEKQLKKIKDRNQNLLLVLVAVLMIIFISITNKNELIAAEKSNVINHGSVPYWMQK